MKSFIFKSILFFGLIVLFSSCKFNQSAINNSSTELQMRPFDLNITEPVSATENFTFILGIDWARLFSFKNETGNFSRNGIIASLGIPVMGTEYMSTDQAMALKKLINENNGMEYDMVLYPRFDRKVRWFPFFSKVETSVTARFAKLK